MKNIRYTLIQFFAALFFLTAGCNITDSADEETSTVGLQMKVDSPQGLMGLLNTDEIEIQELKLFIEEIDLESTIGDHLDFELENLIVNIPLDGSPIDLGVIGIPDGTYDEFGLEIEKPDDLDVDVSDPDFRDETGSYSIVVKGLFNGEPFVFRSSEDFEIDIDLDPPLVIEPDEAALLTVIIDVSSWFKGDSGEVLNPKDPINLEKINENIERSFEIIEDSFDDDDDDDDDE